LTQRTEEPPSGHGTPAVPGEIGERRRKKETADGNGNPQMTPGFANGGYAEASRWTQRKKEMGERQRRGTSVISK
jgi:hypothetical protein